MSLVTLSSKGQVTIPKNIRETLHLQAGDKVELYVNEINQVVMRPITKQVADVCGVLSKYKKEMPVSVEEMDEAIRQSVQKKFL